MLHMCAHVPAVRTRRLLYTHTGGSFEAYGGAKHKAMGFGSYMAVYGALAGPVFDPVSLSGRVLNLGFAFLCLLAVSTYTANLASMLTLAPTVESISSIDELLAVPGATLCVSSSKSSWVSRYPQLSHDMMIKMADDEASLESVANGLCTAAAVANEVLDMSHASDDSYCKLVSTQLLMHERLTMPVSDVYAQRLTVLAEALLADNILEAYLDQAHTMHAVTHVCIHSIHSLMCALYKLQVHRPGGGCVPLHIAVPSIERNRLS